jgi:acetolactate synthase regulatory subunit
VNRRFSLLVADKPDVLLRVCSLLLRRRAVVGSLSYGRSRHPGWARLDVEVAVDERHGRALGERLAALVDVRDVAELSPPRPLGEPPLPAAHASRPAVVLAGDAACSAGTAATPPVRRPLRHLHW